MSLSRKGFLKMLGLGALAAGSKAYGLPSKALEEARAAAKKLKITDIEIFLFDIPLTSPFRIAIGEMKAANDLLVRVITDQGVVGLGEACPFPPITGETQATNAAAARSIREMLIGKDPLAIDSLLREIGPLVHSNPSAVAAFDMALHDILGKVAGLPLFRLLGGTKTTFETDITTSLDTLENMTAESKKYADMGYKTLKVKVGLDPDEDFARLSAIRAAIGRGVAIRIDANQGWTVPQSVYALRKMEPLAIEFCEQPVLASDTAGLRAVRLQSPIAIMADEALFGPADAIKLIRAEACDTFNIKVMKAGGLLNSIRIAHIADAANMRCMVGCMLESKLALTAAAHVVASQANIVYADLDGNSEHVTDPIIDGMTVKAGVLTLPEKPGLGCDVDPAFVKTLRKI
ncbi:MAG: dipeptide epimerase [Candidatus Aminicenantes bacterium]|nr:MAG: dipeptide epimerase [Candidatus Aminicenantes bacterium]